MGVAMDRDVFVTVPLSNELEINSCFIDWKRGWDPISILAIWKWFVTILGGQESGPADLRAVCSFAGNSAFVFLTFLDQLFIKLIMESGEFFIFYLVIKG